MQRKAISFMIVLPLLCVFSFLETYAQPGTGELPGTKSNEPPATGASKPAPARPAPHILIFGAEKQGRLDPKTSNKNPSGNLFEEMALNARSEDALAFYIKSKNPSLSLQILDKNKTEVAVTKDPSGYFKLATPTGGLPVDGQYCVRVTGAPSGRSAAAFKIKVDRLGLTKVAYSERFTQIVAELRDEDPASVEETVAKLEKLAKDSPYLPTAFERLGILYLENRKDVVKAGRAMEQAIKANGAAVIKVSYDSKWRPMTKARSGDADFEDKRVGWLRIQGGRLTLPDGANNKEPTTLAGNQIKESSRTNFTAYNVIRITANNSRKQYFFATETKRLIEADLIVKLIQNYVVGKTSVQE
jgi:hypothetical protein